MEDEHRITRRTFLAGALSAGVLGMAPRALASDDGGDPPSVRPHIRRTLGRTGIELPIVSMGVMNANNPDLVKASYERGVRHFDTAAYYQYGRNEQMVGSVIRDLGVRDDVVVATKVFTPYERRGCDDAAARRKIVETTEGSLRRLGMDYVDILYVHNVSDPDVVRDEAIMEAARELRKTGKARFVGVSTHERMSGVIDAAVEAGVWDVVLTAINFTMSDDAALISSISAAAKAGVGVVAMKTQAGGDRFPERDLVKKYGASTIATAALKWALARAGVTTAIPGYTTYEQMEVDLTVAGGIELTAEERAFLAENGLQTGMGFCRQCRLCEASCPRGADIATLMRTHMYVAQYGNLHHARATLGEIETGRGLDSCHGCGDCSARCPRGVDISRRIGDLRLVYA